MPSDACPFSYVFAMQTLTLAQTDAQRQEPTEEGIDPLDTAIGSPVASVDAVKDNARFYMSQLKPELKEQLRFHLSANAG